jgi:hypothetical protein
LFNVRHLCFFTIKSFSKDSRVGKLYILEYAEVPEVFFTPHSVHTLFNFIFLSMSKNRN